MTHSLSVIAHIRNDFTAKFGIPRQSGLVDTITSKIVFEPEYRNPDAFRGIERAAAGDAEDGAVAWLERIDDGVDFRKRRMDVRGGELDGF